MNHKPTAKTPTPKGTTSGEFSSSSPSHSPHQPSTYKVSFISLGCAKNLVDTQLMAGSLLKNGLSLSPTPDQADVLVVNTCAFIEDAREEACEAIEEACNIKKSGQCRAVIVTGCFAQRYKHDTLDRFPNVDAVLGLDNIDQLAETVREVMAGHNKILRVDPAAKKLFNPDVPGIVFTGGPFAYLKIAEGCNHACAFCTIPSIRGRYRSRPIKDLVAEAEQLLENGRKELNLIAQDTSSYGKDLNGNLDICGLLKALSEIGGEFWIRILYSYPPRIDRKLLECISSLPRVVPYIDVPVQHSHPDILKKMKRGNTVRQVENMAGFIRKNLPGATVRTTCLVGFPGEEERHFEHLAKYVETQEFDHLGVFAYSPEEGTPAEQMPERPPKAVAEERRDIIMNIQKEVVNKINSNLIGSPASALLESQTEEAGSWIGRTQRFAPEVDGIALINDVPEDASPGDIIPVAYTDQAGYDMIATAHPSSPHNQ